MVKKKILIVDDEAVYLHFAKSILTRKGKYEVMAVADTGDLINQINEFKPDIILLNIVMPEPNGIKICHAIKKNLCTANIPIVIISGMCGDESREKVFTAGADDFLVKPIKKESLINKIEEVLSNAK